MGHRGNKRERKRGKKQRVRLNTPGEATTSVAIAHEDGANALELSALEVAVNSTSAADVRAEEPVQDEGELVDADGHRGRDTADAIDLTDLAQAIPEPPELPAEHVPRTRSGVAPRIPVPASAAVVDDDTLNDHLVSLRPFYREGETRPSERADERVLEQAGLDLHALYLGTPLYTPAPTTGLRERAAQTGKWIGLSLIVLSSGYGMWSAAQHFLVAESAAPVAAARPTEASQPMPSTKAATSAAPLAAAPSPVPAADVPSLAQPAAEASAEVDPAEQPSTDVDPNAQAAQAPAVEVDADSAARQATAPSSAKSADATKPSAPATAGAARKRMAETPATSVPAAQPEATAATAPAQPAKATVTPSAAAPESTPAATDTAAAAANASSETGAIAPEQTAEPAAQPAGPLPKRPSASVLRESFQRLRAPMGACVGGRKGVVKIRAVISGNGRLNSGTLEGPFDAPEQRACLTRTLLQLQVPPFEQEAFRVDYALVL